MLSHDLWDTLRIGNFEQQDLHLGLPRQALEMAETTVAVMLD